MIAKHVVLPAAFFGAILGACSQKTTQPTDAEVARQLGLTVAQVQKTTKRKQLTNQQLLDLPDTVKNALVDKAQMLPSAQGRTGYRMLSLRGENGKIPHDARMKAVGQMSSLLTEGTCGGLDSANWTDEGPGTIGGRVRAIAFHPTTPSTMFCGSVAGGIWRSTNSGGSWSKVNDNMENLAITSIVYKPSNSNVMLAATGEGFFNFDSVRGAGIFKSTNGGTSWSRLAGTSNSNFYWVNRLSYNTTGTVVLAATSTGVWRSTNDGATWTRTRTGNCRDVKFNPNNANIAIAERAPNSGGQSTFPFAHFTTDGGVNWTTCTGLGAAAAWPSGRTEFAWSRGFTGRGNGVVYAMRDVNSTLYRSTNGGNTFTQVSTNNNLGGQVWYNNALWVAPFPQNSSVADDLVLIGGLDQWRSTNGGSTFTKISEWSSWPTSIHADHHVILEHPNYNGTTNRQVWFGNDGGVWSTNDVTTVAQLTGWTRRNTNLGITQFYGASIHTGTGILVGGTQDNGTPRRAAATGYNNWSTMQGLDGGYTASDPTDSNYHYAEYQNAWLRRSTDGGLTSSPLQNFPGSNFIAPFILDPNNPNTLYFGAGDLWRSTNVKAGTPTWATIHTPSGRVSAIAVKQGSSKVVWVAHNNGDIYRSIDGTDAAPTFTRRDNTTPNLPNRFVTRIVIDPTNSFHVFACFGGYSTANIWETKNAGTTWTALTGMPSAPVRDLEIHPTNKQILYAATEVGLLVSENGGNTWSSTATPSNVSINEMFFGANNRLYLVTHGRGIFSQSIGDFTDPGDIVYYRFDKGADTSAINYAVSSSSDNPIINGGGERWVTPGRHGRGMLRGSSNTSAANFNYVSTPFYGPLNGSFSVHFWMRERYFVGTDISYLFGHLKTANGGAGFRCFTGGIAGKELAIRGATGLINLKLPSVGPDLQARARGKGGVCVGLSVDADANTAQWYINGLPHGAAITIPAGGAGIPASTTNLRVGEHNDHKSSCVYDLDEFRLMNRAATAGEMRAFCQGPKTLYYKFDKGVGDTVVNYGTSTAPSTMVNSGGAGPWSSPGMHGPSMLRGSSNSSSTHFNYCDTGMQGAIQGDATIHLSMKQVHNPGAGLSYLWGGVNDFRCFTNGDADDTLLVRGFNGTDEIAMPQLGDSLQQRAASASGVCVTLTIDATTKKAQWYVDGAPHGQAIDIVGGLDVWQSASSFKVGKHTSNTTSSAYNIDEFRLLNRVAGLAEISGWCIRPTAGVGRYVPNCGISLSTFGGVPHVGNSTYTHTIQMGTRTQSNCLFVLGVVPALPFNMGLALPALNGCMWQPSFDLQLGLPTDPNGYLELPHALPASPAIAGFHMDTQVLGLNASGLFQSNAVSHVIEIDR